MEAREAQGAAFDSQVVGHLQQVVDRSVATSQAPSSAADEGVYEGATYSVAVDILPATPENKTGTVAKRGLFRRTWGYFDEHLGLSALRYPVPRHANTFWYTLGGMTFVGLIVLVVTGIWLAQFYNPDPGAARASVQFIQPQA